MIVLNTSEYYYYFERELIGSWPKSGENAIDNAKPAGRWLVCSANCFRSSRYSWVHIIFYTTDLKAIQSAWKTRPARLSPWVHLYRSQCCTSEKRVVDRQHSTLVVMSRFQAFYSNRLSRCRTFQEHFNGKRTSDCKNAVFFNARDACQNLISVILHYSAVIWFIRTEKFPTHFGANDDCFSV